MDSRYHEFLAGELAQIKAQGLWKEEWPILGPQGPQIRVEGRAEPVLNFCANNYLGLSGHPELLAAAHAHAGRVGLRPVQRALHLRHPGTPPRAGEARRCVPGHAGRDPVRGVLRRKRRRLRAAPRPRRRDPHGPAEPRLDHRRRAPVQGEAPGLRERGHAGPGREAARGRLRALPADRDGRCVLDGRDDRAARRHLRAGRQAQGAGAGRRLPRHRLHGHDRPRHARALRRARAHRHPDHDVRQGSGRRFGRLHRLEAGTSSICCASAAGRTCSRTRCRPWSRARRCGPSSSSRGAPSCATGSSRTPGRSASG